MDSLVKQEIYQIIDTLAKSGISVIFVSSEMPEILMVSDRIAITRDYTIKNILPKEGVTQEKIMLYMANQEDE
jgi:ABC-type sugar transport system ATPase subunit